MPSAGSLHGWQHPTAHQPTIDSWEAMSADGKRAAVATEKGARRLDPAALREDAAQEMFARWDANGNGALSLAEVDKAVVELLPGYDYKPALMRAYQAAGKHGGGFVEAADFRRLLHFIAYFTELWELFAELDADHDGRLF